MLSDVSVNAQWWEYTEIYGQEAEYTKTQA